MRVTFQMLKDVAQAHHLRVSKQRSDGFIQQYKIIRESGNILYEGDVKLCYAFLRGYGAAREIQTSSLRKLMFGEDFTPER